MKAVFVAAAFNQEKVLVGVFYVIVKTDGLFAALPRLLLTADSAPRSWLVGGAAGRCQGAGRTSILASRSE